MSPFKILRDLGLLEWSTVLAGMKRGWIHRAEAIEFAIQQMLDGQSDDETAVLAAGESLNADEFCSLVRGKVARCNEHVDLDKWRLAILSSIAESASDDQAKINQLQEAYADFGYPADMVSCSVYSQDRVDPLVAMKKVIDLLTAKLGAAKTLTLTNQNLSTRSGSFS